MSQTETTATPKATEQPAEIQEETREQVLARIDAMNARAWELSNNPGSEGQQIAEEALALGEKENYPKGIASALLALGWRNHRKGNYTAMLSQSEIALLYSKR